MGLALSVNERKVDILPAGVSQAVCYGIVDIGTQVIPNSKFPPKHKAVFLFELPNERIDVEKNGETQNKARTISAKYTLSLNPKGNLRKQLKGWRGRDLTQEEEKCFELRSMIGANCQLSIVHEQGRGQNSGKTYACIGAILPPAKGMPRVAPETATIFFSFADQVPGVVNFPPNIPDWIKELAMQSTEYKTIISGQVDTPAIGSTNTSTGNTKQVQQAVRDINVSQTDDVPF